MSMGNPNYVSANSFVLVRCYMCVKGLKGGKSTFKEEVFVVPKSEYKKVVSEYKRIYKKTTNWVKFEILEGNLSQLKLLSLNGRCEVEQAPFFTMYPSLNAGDNKYYIPEDAKIECKYDKRHDIMHFYVSGNEPYIFDDNNGEDGINIAANDDGAIEKILVFDWHINAEKVWAKFPELQQCLTLT